VKVGTNWQTGQLCRGEADLTASARATLRAVEILQSLVRHLCADAPASPSTGSALRNPGLAFGGLEAEITRYENSRTISAGRRRRSRSATHIQLVGAREYLFVDNHDRPDGITGPHNGLESRQLGSA